MKTRVQEVRIMPCDGKYLHLQLAADVFSWQSSRRSRPQAIAKIFLNTISFRSVSCVNGDNRFKHKCDKQKKVLYTRSEGTARSATAGPVTKKVNGVFSLCPSASVSLIPYR
jgi:hypothetical protein